MKIKEAIRFATKELQEICERPSFEASLLLSFYLGVDRVYLTLNEDMEVANIEQFKSIIHKRKESMPIEYITSRVSFYDIELFIKEGALIPRPETELLIDEVSKIIKEHNITKIAEIGIGSGAISIVLARKFPNMSIVATDISQDAIDIAMHNIKSFGLEDRISVLKVSLLDGIKDRLELVVSNPPYIANDFKLEKNVANYEPKAALFGGQRGDELLKKIIDTAKNRGVGYLACEMGYDQRGYIEQYLSSIKIKSVKFYRDLHMLDRGFIIQF